MLFDLTEGTAEVPAGLIELERPWLVVSPESAVESVRDVVDAWTQRRDAWLAGRCSEPPCLLIDADQRRVQIVSPF